ncbi:hypothetical protein HH1059_14230 [Halorhodospira halochloris]|uniref:Apea-like HEPN domain-containing protein n=1 Tax=Halorhodospira halochloris TaxID=1052 RepID=A0A2Z6EZI5_HALHR|nr:hypothetical protein [Halorhodospira halochloris]MBK1653012.1 hypothetical protein [Halorhodospira halochloris]BBE11080.1 hypothetical protein HH1059_14230 [Halorhodospira halochloris]
MICPYEVPNNEELDYGRFERSHREGRRLVEGWANRAYRELDCDAQEAFEPFIFLWIAFNAWAACVTGEDRDANMIRRVANCPKTRDLFSKLLEEDDDFQRTVQSFADLWPIFKAQDIRRAGHFGHISDDRREVIEHYRGIEGIAYEPRCAFFHQDAAGAVPVDWPHCLNTIYRVRCNLFHGEKSPHSEMDARVVKNAFDTLAHFFLRTAIIPPNNRIHQTGQRLRGRPAGEP